MEAFELALHTNVTFTAYLVELHDLKVVAGGKKVLTMIIVADTSSVLQVSIWNEKANHIYKSLTSVFESCDAFPQIQVKSVDIIEVTASPKRIVRVQSNKGTAVEIIGKGTVAFQPSANFVISNFGCFGRGGEQAILRGRVAQLDGLRTTRAGDSMRSMLLVDSQATGLPCMVHGALSEDEDVLQEGAELLIYWASAEAGLVSEECPDEEATGHFWIYADRFICQLSPPGQWKDAARAKTIKAIVR